MWQCITAIIPYNINFCVKISILSYSREYGETIVEEDIPEPETEDFTVDYPTMNYMDYTYDY